MELLAPAGSFAALKSAVSYGADAVYFGLNGFNARAKADNCGEDNLGEWLSYCHRFGVKAYVAVNTLMKNGELADALAGIRFAYELGADAFIVQDLGLISLINQAFPNADVHLSTQAGVFSCDSIVFLSKKLRFSRVILPRECGKEEIQNAIRSGKEIEVFAHGALCVAFSGNCYFSSMLTANSGNRGKCQQFCRMLWRGTCGSCKREGYLLSTADLCMLEQTEELKNLGVSSLKIEGRMRRPEYVAEAVRCYRKAIDGQSVTYEDMRYLKEMFNRGDFTSAYYQGDFRGTQKSVRLIDREIQGHRGVPVGRVLSVRNGIATVKVNRSFTKGDGFKIFEDAHECGSGVFYDQPAPKELRISCSEHVRPGCAVHITTDRARMDELNAFDKKLPLNLSFTAARQKPVQLTASCGTVTVTAFGTVPALARNRELDCETVKKQLGKLGDTDYSEEQIQVNVGSGLFVEVSALNQLRRDVIAALNKRLSGVREHVEMKSETLSPVKNIAQNVVHGVNFVRKHAIILSNITQFHSTMFDIVDEIVLFPTEMNTQLFRNNVDICKNMYLALPHFIRKKDMEEIGEILPLFRGVYAENAYALALAKKYELPVFGGELNVCNSETAAFYSKCGVKRILLSKELNRGEVREIVRDFEIGGNMAGEGVELYLPVFGQIPLMWLNHCPVQTITDCTCSDCRYRENEELFLTDRMNERFPIVRYHWKNKCYFSVCNNLPLNAMESGTLPNVHFLLNFTGFSRQETLDMLSQQAKTGAVTLPVKTTSGHIKRGVN